DVEVRERRSQTHQCRPHAYSTYAYDVSVVTVTAMVVMVVVEVEEAKVKEKQEEEDEDEEVEVEWEWSEVGCGVVWCGGVGWGVVKMGRGLYSTA
ncbi:unnamed protein product, partial [Hydatigera taeniaeformis]|uniref:Ovule protein n=1 Tax=Hydatigena taeniaeformis TaxID=6205 RepID=A0A0R3WYI7_HYDTA